VVAEQFPRGGALTLNAVAGVGMLAAGIVGGPFLGYIQDTQVGKEIAAYDQSHSTQLHTAYVTQTKVGVFGEYVSLDHNKVESAPETDKAPIHEIQGGAKKSALATVAMFPILMMLCYVGLILYFRSKGGYRPVEI
jgi:hypothetical protein